VRGFLTSPILGLLVLTLLGAWPVLAHPAAPETTSWAAACAVLAVGILAGAVGGRADPAVPGLVALAVAVGAVVVTVPDSLSGAPLAPPLGYMNANGALLLGGAAGAVVAAGPRVSWRHGSALVSVAVAAVCLVDGAQAAAVACLAVAGWAALRGRGPAWPWVVVGSLSVVTPAVLTVLWASAVLTPPSALVSALSQERFSLWSEAWALLLDNPLSGVGPGRFSFESPTAGDSDLAWAHSALLQTGAETGWVGVSLLLLVVVWGVVALGRDSILLGALLLPASVDYVLHFGGVLLVSSLVVGGAVASSRRGKP